MRRVLALLAAVALIAGAVVLRDRLGGGGGDDGEDQPEPVAAGIVSCVAEVFAACQVATGNVARSVTAGSALDDLVVDPLAASDAEVDAWVLPRYVVDAVEAQRARDGAPPAFGEVSDTIAHTEVVPVGVPDRMAALERACGRPVDWACLAERAGTSWAELGEPFPGPVRLGIDPPATSATGLVALGALGGAALGAFDPNQIETQAWFQTLDRRLADRPTGQTALAVLATRPGTYDVAAALVADARGVAREVTIASPSPAAVLEIVMAAGAGREVDDDLASEVGDELTRAGWSEGEPPPSLVPAGDVLAAVRNITG